jgi:hypothetical protein
VHVEEIERQLNGIKPPDVIVPTTVQYDLPERAAWRGFFPAELMQVRETSCKKCGQNS